VTPIVDGERLLVVGRYGIRAIALHDGRLSDLVAHLTRLRRAS